MDNPLREKIVASLKECYDPEIPVNIVDLGLIYDLGIEEGMVHVKMGLTAPGCPMGMFIVDQVKRAVKRVQGVKDVVVELISEPRWTPDRMTAEARKSLGV